MAKGKAANANMGRYGNSITQDRLRERFRVAAQFLLNCFESMHHLEMTESICFVLQDIGTFLLGMSSSSRRQEFSGVPFAVMDELGFLKKTASARLDLTIVTKDEMLLLFVVHHLSLNGKSHFEEVVKELRNRAPQLISMILSCASVPGKLVYLRKYPQYFRVDDTGHLELPSTFNLTIEDSPDDSESSSEASGINQSGVNVISCDVDGGLESTEVKSSVRNGHEKKSDVHLLESNVTSSECHPLDFGEYFNDKTSSVSVGNIPLTVNSESLKEFYSKFQSNTSNEIFSQEGQFQNDKKISKNVNLPVEKEYIYNIKLDEPSGMLSNRTQTTKFDRICLSPNSDSQTMFLSGLPKLPNVASPAARYESDFFSIEKASSNNPNKSDGSIALSEPNEKAKNFRSEVNYEASEDCEVSLVNKVQDHMTNRVCTLIREGIVFLFEHFKCQIDMHLFCVVLHALDEVKRPFLRLIQLEQMALVEKILAPLWIAGVEDNSGTYLKHSSETFELNKEQNNLLFISYAVSQSEKLHSSTLLGMFEEHKMDVTELKEIDMYVKWKRDLFSIDEDECIAIENFPPAKWMADRLSSVISLHPDSYNTSVVQSENSQMANDVAISFGDLSLDQPRISKTVPKDSNDVGGDTTDDTSDAKETIEEMQANVSGYSQDTLDNVAVGIHDGLIYLSQFFDLNVYSGLLEVVLHVVKDYAVFFGLSSQQQMEVIKGSFRDFHIDGQGRAFSITTKQKKFILTKTSRMLLCMAYIVNRNVCAHYLEVFTIYIAYVGSTNQSAVSDQFEYFRKREDIFFISSDGYVRLANVSTVKFNYISILLSDRINAPVFVNHAVVMPRMNPNPMFFNTAAVGPRMNPRPIIFNRGAAIPGTNFRPPIFNPNAYVPLIIDQPIFNSSSVFPRMNFGPMFFNTGTGSMIVNTGVVMPRMNCNPMAFNTGALIRETNRTPVLNSCVEKNENEIPMTNEVNAAKDKTFTEEEKSISVVDTLTQTENVSVVQHSNCDNTLNSKDEEKEAKRVKDGVLYLSRCFVLETDDLTLIFCVLEDVKSYLLKLASEPRGEFVKKCVSHLVVRSKCSVSSTATKSNYFTVNYEEKIALFIALLLRREKELHYAQIFDKFHQFNTATLPCVKSVIDQCNFVIKWKHIFAMSPAGNVKLLPSMVKSSEVFSINNECVLFKTLFSENITTRWENKNLKFDTKDHLTHFLEANFNPTLKTKSIPLKTMHCRAALSYYVRIKESIVYLSRTFEVISAEQIMKAIFCVLRDVRVLFVKTLDVHKYILKALYSHFSVRNKPRVPMDELKSEKSKLSQDEKNLLVLICILTETRKMHYQELFNVFESHGGYIASLLPKNPYLYLKKKRKCFAVHDAGDVSLKNNHALKSFNLDGFFKDSNLKSSISSAVLEGSHNNAFTVAEGRKKRKSSSGCIQREVLHEIHNICNDVLAFFKQMRCNTKQIHVETGKQNSDVILSIKTDSNTESTKSIGATENKTEHDSVSNETNLIDMKPTDVSTKHSITDNRMIDTSRNKSFSISKFPQTKKISDHSDSPHTIKLSQKSTSCVDPVKPFSFITKDIPCDVSNQANASQVCQTFDDQRRKDSRSDCISVCQDKPDSNILTDSPVAHPHVYRNGCGPTEDCDKAISRKYAPIFNLLELLSDDEPPAVSSKNVKPMANSSIISDCGCTKDLTKELRTMNFFLIILGQFKVGLSVPVLTKKLLLASTEVQHYISCVYKGNILNFLKNHDNFLISPTSGNVCCKR